MPSFGEKLKAEREKRSITLEQISLSTKIGTRMLQALEEDKFNQLPGGIFNKGFVRAYARHVGIDEDQAVADYLEASGENVPFRPGSDQESALGKIAEPGLQPASSERSRELPWGLFAAALLAIALGLSLWTHHKRTSTSPTAPAETPQSTAAPAIEELSRSSNAANTEIASSPKSPVPDRASSTRQNQANPASLKTAAVQPASTGKVSRPETAASQLTSAPAVATPVAGDSDEFTVLIQVREDSWISITADGKTLASYMANAGAQRAVRGRQLVTIKAGNVGGVDFLFNGKKLGPQGEAGQVKTLAFGPEGLQPSPPPTVSQ